MYATTDMLREKGLKVTPQRLAIYNYLCNTENHPNAEEIFKDLYEEYPTMSLSTVYKTVETLLGKNLIIELNIPGDSLRYDAKIEDHDHFLCLKCRSIKDIKRHRSEIRELPKELSGCNVTAERLYYFGQCEKCQEPS